MRLISFIVFFTVLAGACHAEVIAAKADHYTLKQEAVSTLNPEMLWKRLIQPKNWWDPSHTYSGDAGNMSLTPKAGGLWIEKWQGNSVAHGEILLVSKNKMLRLEAPFGPLQEMAVSVVWTITINRHEGGTKITFTEVANGTSASDLDGLAPIVDAVKTQAIARLAETPEN